jgi:hypothetical protein
VYTTCKDAASKTAETEKTIIKAAGPVAFFRVVVRKGSYMPV